MDFYRISEPQVIMFALILIRITALFVAWPVFGEAQVPVQIKILCSLTIAMMIFPTLTVPPQTITDISTNLISVIVREVFIGLMIGYLARFFFFVFAMAGELISMSMGLGSAQMFNPSLGTQTSALSQFYIVLASLFFMGSNGHHILLSGLVDTFSYMPPSATWFTRMPFYEFAVNSQHLLEIGLRLSAPILISILVVNLILGIAGKTVPQMNVLVTSFSVNIITGIAILLFSLPLFMDQMESWLVFTSEGIFNFMRSI